MGEASDVAVHETIAGLERGLLQGFSQQSLLTRLRSDSLGKV